MFHSQRFEGDFRIGFGFHIDPEFSLSPDRTCAGNFGAGGIENSATGHRDALPRTAPPPAAAPRTPTVIRLAIVTTPPAFEDNVADPVQ